MTESIEEIREAYQKSIANCKAINMANKKIYEQIDEKERKLKKELKDLLSGNGPAGRMDLCNKSNE